ncbi:reticulon-4-like [Protopterus annectens]|uniref:reticulon-4-like n=1 Tax=Protopterus annectens TaxID=7888 RepID=UPI001CFAD4D3|nr:reticulon-4-like [Protopterus annectens]
MEDAVHSPQVSSSSSSDFERLSSGDGSREDLTVPDYTAREEEDGRVDAKEMQPVTAQVVDSPSDAQRQPVSTAWEPMKLDVTPPKAEEEVPHSPISDIRSQEDKTQSKPTTKQVPSDDVQVTSLTAESTCCDESFSPHASPLYSAEGLVDFKKQPSNTEFIVGEEGFVSTVAKSSAPRSSLSPLSESLGGQISAAFSADTNQKPITALEEELLQSSGGNMEFIESLKSDQSEGNDEQEDTRQTVLVSSETAITEQVSDDKGMGKSSDNIYDTEHELKQDSFHALQTMSAVHAPVHEELPDQVISSTPAFDSEEQEYLGYDQDNVLEKCELSDDQTKLHDTDVIDSSDLVQSTENAENETLESEVNVQMESDAGKPALVLESLSVQHPTSVKLEERDLEVHENLREPSRGYATFAAFEPSSAYFGDDLSPVVEETLVAKPKDSVLDQVHTMPYEIISSEPEPFVSIGQAAITPDSLSKSSADSSTNASEIPTPDLVQGAHEGDLHDVIYLKNSDESTVDLVQTLPEPPKDTPSPITMSPSPEGSDSVQSPILPDIIMESPSNMNTYRVETTVSASPEPRDHLLETDIQQEVPCVQESSEFVTTEKSNDSSLEVLAASVGITPVDIASIQEPMYAQNTTEEMETPYMSVSCDLIKETTSKEKVPLEVVGSVEPFPLEAFPEYTASFEQAIKSPTTYPEVPLVQDASDLMQSKDVHPNLALHLVEGHEEASTPSPDRISREMVEGFSPSEVGLEYSHSSVEILKGTAPLIVEEPIVKSFEMESLKAELAEALEEPVTAVHESRLEQPITFAHTRDLEEPISVGDGGLEEPVRVANFREYSRVCVEPYVSENIPLDHETFITGPVKDGFDTLISATVKSAAEAKEHEIIPPGDPKVVFDSFESEKTEWSHAALADTTYFPPLDIHEVKRSTELIEIPTLPGTLEKQALEDLEKPLLLEDAAVAEETSFVDRDNTSESNAALELPSSSSTQETHKDTASVLTKLNKTEGIDLLYCKWMAGCA